jgi:anti-sigma-K factor RskA
VVQLALQMLEQEALEQLLAFWVLVLVVVAVLAALVLVVTAVPVVLHLEAEEAVVAQVQLDNLVEMVVMVAAAKLESGYLDRSEHV